MRLFKSQNILSSWPRQILNVFTCVPNERSSIINASKLYLLMKVSNKKYNLFLLGKHSHLKEVSNSPKWNLSIKKRLKTDLQEEYLNIKLKTLNPLLMPFCSKNLELYSTQLNYGGLQSFRSYSTNKDNKDGNDQYKKYIILFLAIAGGYGFLEVSKRLYTEEDEILQLPPEIVVEPHEKRDPSTSIDIPDEIGYVIVGGGAAAFSASRTIKSRDETAKIVIFTQESFHPYMRPPLSKELLFRDDKSNVENLRFVQWNGVERSIFYEIDEFYTPCVELNKSETGGISVARGWKVVHIDPFKRFITLDDGKIIKYNKCLLATGSSPKALPFLEKLPPAIKDKVLHYRTINDYKKLVEPGKQDSKSIAVYGSGILGSELASSLAMKGNKTEVTHIFPESAVMENIMPGYLSDLIKSHMSSEGIRFFPNCDVTNITMEDDQLCINLTNDVQVKADHLLICATPESNTEIAKASGLEVDQHNGGFIVNAQLQVIPHLYAAGDCASYYDIVLNKRRTVFRYDHAIATGRLAGANMTGAEKPLTHQGMIWSEFGDKYSFEGVGNIGHEFRTFGTFTQAEKSEESNDQPLETDYSKGVVFYLNDDVIEGVLLWNIFNRTGTARRVIAERKKFNDLKEVTKLFDIFGKK